MIRMSVWMQILYVLVGLASLLLAVALFDVQGLGGWFIGLITGAFMRYERPQRIKGE